MRRAIAALVAATLLLGACSEDDASQPGSTAVTTSTGAPQAPTTGPNEGSTTGPATTEGSTTGPATTEGSASSPATTIPPAATSPDTSQGTTSTTQGDATTIPQGELPLADLVLRATPVADGFRQPVFLDAPTGDRRLFVVDQTGIVYVIDGGARSVFLDISDRVVAGGEQGLLGLAFHPGFADNGRFFVHYTGAGGDTVVAEYRVGDDPGRADPETSATVFTTPQPAGNHNGGMLAFGPDGYLYVALGDGGGAGDRYGNGQDPATPLGAILRLDVDGGTPYAVPPENPFAGGGGAPEIWAWGLRNPWRFSFDGDLVYIGDVGQDSWEEIDVVDRRSGGPNLGWPEMEGTHCFATTSCSPAAFVSPVLEYGHGEGHCSVTGGYVYRGSAIPGLQGAYFFGDFCSGTIWSFFLDGEGVYALRDWAELTAPGLTSFGTDGFGELYLVTAAGTVLRIDPGT
jgi:glucose/arabinose dehydrogenase